MKLSVTFSTILLAICFSSAWTQKTNNENYSLDSIRKLALDENTELPHSINAFITGEGTFPGWAVYKDCKEKKVAMVFSSFQIKYPEQSIIVDVPFTKEQFDKFKYKTRFNSGTFYALEKEIRNTETIILTHEHGDHVVGLLKYKDEPEIVNKLILIPEQISSKQMKKNKFPEGYFDNTQQIEYDKYYKLSPGVVLIKTPSHTPGHQILYVKLQNNEEYLLIGDVVWNMKSIELQKPRPWIVRLMLKEDKKKNVNQIKWLKEIQDQHKDMHIVPSHDIEEIKKTVSPSFQIHREI